MEPVLCVSCDEDRRVKWRLCGTEVLLRDGAVSEGDFITAVTSLISAGDNFADFLLLLWTNYGLMRELIKQLWSNQVRKCIKSSFQLNEALFSLFMQFAASRANYKTKQRKTHLSVLHFSPGLITFTSINVFFGNTWRKGVLRPGDISQWNLLARATGAS